MIAVIRNACGMPEGPPGHAAAEDVEGLRDAVDRARAEDLQAEEQEDVRGAERDDDGVHPAVGDQQAVDQAEHAADGDRDQHRRRPATVRSTSSFAVITEQTMIAAPTETSMPPVMMMIVMPTPTRAIGAVATSSGWIEPAVKKAGVANARTTQITAMTPISTSSWPETGDGRIRLRGRGGDVGGSAAPAAPGFGGRGRVGRWRAHAGVSPRSSYSAPAAAAQHVDLGGVRPELDGRGAAADHLQPVGDAQCLGQVRGHHQHRGAVLGQLGDDPVDLLLGADVDALGGLGQHQHLRPLDELPGQHDLLGVAAGHRADRLPLVRRLAPPGA